MDGQQRKRRRTANKDLVGTTSLLQILSKNITAVKRAHELVNEADSEDEDSGVQKVLDNNKSKMIISAQRIIQSPRPSHSKKLADEERLVLRDLNIAIQLARDSEYPRDELQAKFDVLKGVFQHSTPSGHELRAIESWVPVEMDNQLASWKPMVMDDAEEAEEFLIHCCAPSISGVAA